MSAASATDQTAQTGPRPALLRRVRAGRLWRWGRWPLLVGTLAALVGTAWFAWLYSTTELPADPPQLASSVVLDNKGNEIAAFGGGELRVPVPLERISPAVPDALVAAEDRTFWEHRGVNPAGIARAVVTNLRTDRTEGGSTITQQLVKNEFVGAERSWTRKLREAILAVKLERREDKTQIMERYLNTVYFGRGAYGIEAAARVYFDRSAAELTDAQAAFLVATLPGPGAVEPTEHPTEAIKHRDLVIDAMVATGTLNAQEAAAARTEPIGVTPRTQPVTLTAGIAPHFVEWVRRELVDRYGESTVHGGGLRIHTTLDVDDQRAAEATVRDALSGPDDPQAAIVGVTKDGAVTAYVGGKDPAVSVDLARGTAGGGGGRQSGSTFKPFALAANLERGTPLSRRRPAPAQMTLPGNPPWEVANYGGQGFGPLDEIEATAKSVNTVFAQMGAEVGPKAVADIAKRSGITSPLGENPAIVLGVDSVSPLELAGAYLTFARDGSSVTPYAIAEVRDLNGELLAGKPDTQRPAMDPGVSRAVTYALGAAVEQGTGTAALLDRPMAGKTGTTEDYGDAWFAGYTPEYAAVVWVGYPEGPQRKMTNVHGRAVTGGSLPAEMWATFAGAALADVPPTPFPAPPDHLVAGVARPMSLSVAGPVPPGGTITATGSGFENCVAGFWVEAHATQTLDGRPGPAGLRSAPETNSTAGDRSTTLTLPVDAPEGGYTAVAHCDESGNGARPVAEAPFGVDDGITPPPTTTTTTQPPPPVDPPVTVPTVTAPTRAPGGGGVSTTTTTTAETTTTETRRRR